VVLETHYVVGLPPQFGKAVARRHRHRKHEPLGIAHAGGAQSRAGRRARRDAVVNHNRRAASDLRAFAIAQVTLAPPLDFGEFGVANGFVNSNVLNDVLIAICADVGTCIFWAFRGIPVRPLLPTRSTSCLEPSGRLHDPEIAPQGHNANE
jgi:hypothetical protein